RFSRFNQYFYLSIICVKFVLTHMCQFSSGSSRGVCSSICVKFSSGSAAARIAPYVSISLKEHVSVKTS
ncbi:MAG TPA: hypothetical protein PK899_10685, partial [Spirochaetota bacterium]|nr:hypothetical protein [Spirochaetota bacterium]